MTSLKILVEKLLIQAVKNFFSREPFAET